MKNTAKRLKEGERATAKQWYSDTIRNGDLMVTGNDWEYNMIQAEQAGTEWLQGRRFGLLDVARFFGVPADLIDAAVSGQSVTYANITQRNVQFLIMHLGPTVTRREKNLTKLLPTPRYCKLNRDALLAMDPETRQRVIRSRLETWQTTNSEARRLDNLPPLSPAERAEMIDIYGRPFASGVLPGSMGSPTTEDSDTIKEGMYPKQAAPAPASPAGPPESDQGAPKQSNGHAPIHQLVAPGPARLRSKGESS
jgi:hypothetical protein